MKNLLLVLLILQSTKVFTQKKELPDSLRQEVIGARLHSGFIYAHSVHIQNTKGLKPYGFEFEYSHLRTDSSVYKVAKCYPRTGFSVTFVDFNSRLLGKSYSASYFLEPDYRLSDKLTLLLRGSGGLSYLTNPHDSIKNPANQTYSGHVNIFLELGLGLSYPVSNHFTIYAMGSFFHNSNGGFKLPNAGINYINASLGLQYFKYSTHLPSYNKVKDTAWKHQPLHLDVSVFYSPKGGYKRPDSALVAQRKYVLGTSVQLVKQVSSLDALTVAAEIYYDDALRSIKDIIVKDNSSSTLAGVLIGHQFLLNHFVFSQQLGVYIFKQTDVYNRRYENLFHTIYHRWGISYKIDNHWSAGVVLLAHNQVADFIDARVTYRIK